MVNLFLTHSSLVQRLDAITAKRLHSTGQGRGIAAHPGLAKQKTNYPAGVSQW